MWFSWIVFYNYIFYRVRVQFHSILPLYLLCTSIARNWRSLLLLEGDIAVCESRSINWKQVDVIYSTGVWKTLAMLSSIISAAYSFTVIGSAAQIITFVSQTEHSEPSRRKLALLKALVRHVLAKVYLLPNYLLPRNFCDSRAKT